MTVNILLELVKENGELCISVMETQILQWYVLGSVK